VRIDLRISLADALGISAGDLVSIAGAGGKTSLMYGLGRELSSQGRPALLTTTTRIMHPGRREVAEVVLGPEAQETIDEVARSLRATGLVLAGCRRSDSKIIGYSPGFVERLRAEGRRWIIVSECDGARGKSLKVPRETEPPMASSTTVYVVMVGADCLGKTLKADEIFEPERIAQVAGVGPDSKVDKDVVARAILSEASYLGKKPPDARLCVFLNKIDPEAREAQGSGGPARQALALGLALTLKKHPAVGRVVLGSLRRGGNPFLVVW